MSFVWVEDIGKRTADISKAAMSEIRQNIDAVADNLANVSDNAADHLEYNTTVDSDDDVGYDSSYKAGVDSTYNLGVDAIHNSAVLTSYEINHKSGDDGSDFNEHKANIYYTHDGTVVT